MHAAVVVLVAVAFEELKIVVVAVALGVMQ